MLESIYVRVFLSLCIQCPEILFSLHIPGVIRMIW